MKTIVTCSQMRELDRYTIQNQKMPSEVLMERAALSVVERLEKKKKSLRRVLIVCGTGNNGGDGVAVGRILWLKGYHAEICCLGNPAKFSPDLKKQIETAQNYQVPFVNNPSWDEYTTIVDAIFGAGLSREVTGIYAQAVAAMNQAAGRKVAVDVPSGLDGDHGQVLGCAFQADETVTFGFLKAGLCFYPGQNLAGKITVADIGIYEKGCEPAWEYCHAFEKRDLKKLLPKRREDGNKGTFGKILILAGSRQIAGAAGLCAAACLKSGAGMVKIFTPRENREILQGLLPEALLSVYDSERPDFGQLQADLEWCDAVAAGPGLGQEDYARDYLRYLLEHSSKPLVLDADGLNLFAGNPQWKELLPPVCVFTPHAAEMSRLTKLPVGEIKADFVGQVINYAKTYGVTCVLKDARTVTAAPDGRCWINLSGNSGMATAGSGDVLTGILAALLAGGEDPSVTAAAGVYLHGQAGDIAGRKQGKRSMTARDLILALPKVFV